MLSYYIRLRLPCQGFSLAFLFLFLSANTLKVLIVGRVMPYVCHISIYLCDDLEYAMSIAILLTLRVIIPIYTNVVKG